MTDTDELTFESQAARTARYERQSLHARLRPCTTCRGRGTLQDRPDSFGNFDPCDRCEGLGVLVGPQGAKR